MSAVQSVGPYRLGERVGTSVWKAVDSRNEKAVALKILTKQLPKDTAKRDAVVRDVKVAAAVYHASIVPIMEVLPVGDNLVMVMESVEAQSLSLHVGGKPLPRQEFFRLTYQLVDAVRFLHTKGLVHGNINTDSVLVSANGQLRLGGLNLTNLLPRRDGMSGAYQQKGADARSVAYMAPEQITGAGTDTWTDVFSLGVVMYELATGKLPYNASNAADFARAIVEGQPLSPKTAYPGIDNDILIVLGRCLFKDQYRRHKDAKAIAEDISKVEPDAVRAVSEMSPRAPTASAAQHDPASRQAILFIADVANYEQLAASDPAAASRAVSRMQQVLGEAVFLFDGQIEDPFGQRLIAELPNVESALEAARKGEFDFSDDQQSDPRLEVRLLLHAGAVKTQGGTVVGDAVAKAIATLEHVPPLQLHLTEEFVRKGRGLVRVRDAGARGGMKLYTIAPAESTARPPSAPEASPRPTALSAAAHTPTVVTDADEPVLPPLPKRSLALPIAAAVIALILIAGAAAFFFKSGKKEAPRPIVAGPAPAVVSVEKKVAIAPIAIDGADANGALAGRADAIRVAVLEILRSAPGIRVVDTPDATTVALAPVIRVGTAGPELLPSAAEAAAPVPLLDAATGIQSVIQWISAKVNVPIRRVSNAPEVLNAFADALMFQAANDIVRTEPAVRAAAADPGFLAAQMLAMRFFTAQGKNDEAIAAGQRMVALDPANIGMSRDLARLALGSGAVQPAFAAYATILKQKSADMEALTQVARYAAAIGDSDRFTRTLVRLNTLSAEFVPVHAPDLLMMSGQMDSAIDKYYDIEVNVPNNAALALKIGKISVLRRSLPIAELELKKLEQGDPSYGYHLLKAYIEASKGNRPEATSELEIAATASTPGDDFWTSAAEVHAILGGTTEVMDALERAAARREPTAMYVLKNPLFAYLRSDSRYAGLRAALNAQQEEIRNALAQVGI